MAFAKGTVDGIIDSVDKAVPVADKSVDVIDKAVGVVGKAGDKLQDWFDRGTERSKNMFSKKDDKSDDKSDDKPIEVKTAEVRLDRGDNATTAADTLYENATALVDGKYQNIDRFMEIGKCLTDIKNSVDNKQIQYDCDIAIKATNNITSDFDNLHYEDLKDYTELLFDIVRRVSPNESQHDVNSALKDLRY